MQESAITTKIKDIITSFTIFVERQGKIIWEFGPMNSKPDLNEIVATNLFQKLRSMKLIDETELRNLKIRNEYKELRNSFTASTSIQILSEKYSLSDSTLNNILFRKRILKLKLPVVFS